MASYKCLYPQAVLVDSRRQHIKWSKPAWAHAQTFDSPEYPTPKSSERVFYIIGIKKGINKSSGKHKVAALGVTSDAKYGIEKWFSAEIDSNGKMKLSDSKSLPPAFCRKPLDKQTIPNKRRDHFLTILEEAHGISDSEKSPRQ